MWKYIFVIGIEEIAVEKIDFPDSNELAARSDDQGGKQLLSCHYQSFPGLKF